MISSQLKFALRHLMSVRLSPFIWGPPGVGKSDLVRSIAKDDKLQIIEFRMAQRDPTDIKGFPMPDTATKTMKFFRDGELPTKGKGILFLDELNSAAPATQAAAMQLTLTGKIGDYKLPTGWHIIGAGNRESDRSVVNRMPSALANRFVHLDFDVSLEDWCQWAIDNNMPTGLISFIRFRPNLLHAFDPLQRAFPTPRSWSFASKIMNSGLDEKVEFELLRGTVGEGAAIEFSAFLQTYRELPCIDNIMSNPSTAEVPTNPATLYALSIALGAKVQECTFDQMMAYITRMPLEFQVLTVRDAVRKDKRITRAATYHNWCSENISVVT